MSADSEIVQATLAAERRLAAARVDVGTATRWCRRHNAKLTLSANYHHWLIEHGARRAEWWPLKARLVLDGRGRRARPAPDWAEVSAVMTALWALREPVDRKRDEAVTVESPSTPIEAAQ